MDRADPLSAYRRHLIDKLSHSSRRLRNGPSTLSWYNVDIAYPQATNPGSPLHY